MRKARYWVIAAAAAVAAAVVILLLNLFRGNNTPLEPDTRNVTGGFVVSEDYTLPEGETLYVKNGGRLYILKDAKFTLNGTLKIASGGSVFVQGRLISEPGSLISDTGRLKIQKSGTVSLGGILRVNKTGSVLGKGCLEVLNSFSDIVCKGSVTAKIQAPEPVLEDGVTYVGGVLLVNREYKLPRDYGSGLDEDAYSAYLAMREASGFDMSIVSGYRSYTTQRRTFERWASIYGYEEADRFSAQPGHSEHQAGLAVDITSLEQSYADTDEGKWLAEHCWEYGFIIRYPEDSEDITGYIYEPWHVRYLGESTARLVHDSGLTLEEFLGAA